MLKKTAVWVARLLLGVTFMLSGMAKMIDLHGSINKFNDYFAAWGITDLFPEGLVLMAATGLAMAEFLTGFTLATGSMRRTSAVCATAIMVFMLPLSAYIWAANPVEDCGCFGDWLIISNAATFWKNVVLTALALFLLRYNNQAPTLFAPWIQWVQIAVAATYCGFIGVIGYNEQPLIDFRPYPVGTSIVPADDEDLLQTYVYRSTADGSIAEYDIYNLPDETEHPELEFIEIRDASPSDSRQTNTFAILDPETGQDITDSVIADTSGPLLLMLIPDLHAAGVSMSYNANELASHTPLIALTDATAAEIDRWRDLAMADYPVYRADARTLATIARGKVALVMTRDGIILWKRTLSSVDTDADLARYDADNGSHRFLLLTTLFLALQGSIFLLGSIPGVFRPTKTKNTAKTCTNKKNSLNLRH